MEVKPPKYYDKLYDIEYPEKMEVIKENRKKKAENLTKNKYRQTTLYQKEQLKTEEKTKQDKANTLIRSKV